MAKLHRMISGWLNRFSSDICRIDSGEPAASGGRQIEALEKRMLLTASISGTVFNDLNDDAVYGAGEPGMAGVVVYVDVNDTHSFVATDPNATMARTLGTDGCSLLTNSTRRR